MIFVLDFPKYSCHYVVFNIFNNKLSQLESCSSTQSRHQNFHLSLR